MRGSGGGSVCQVEIPYGTLNLPLKKTITALSKLSEAMLLAGSSYS